MGEIQRPGALYQQVAAEIRKAITAGEFPPGAALPSESQLIARYGVSRPTVRNAIAALRAEGLVEVVHGKGSFVRFAAQPQLTVDRRITQDRSGRFTAADGAQWDHIEEPAVQRTQTTTATAAALEVEEGEALFACDRLLSDPATGTRVLHRTLIPFATAEGTPLADAPDSEPVVVYGMLAEAGHMLTWTETVQARMPLPDERTTLQIPDATPILHTLRTTHGNDHQPLLLEEFRVSADRAQLTYRINADKPATRRRSRA
ncbi:GntR family transcriptional regulator [Streptomyces albireticuli]|uniref:GntR family transcriptional regulator n=1 Tax=Streptomyces albireticuli TaxID=1940 RepID=UPI0036C313E3